MSAAPCRRRGAVGRRVGGGAGGRKGKQGARVRAAECTRCGRAGRWVLRTRAFTRKPAARPVTAARPPSDPEAPRGCRTGQSGALSARGPGRGAAPLPQTARARGSGERAGGTLSGLWAQVMHAEAGAGTAEAGAGTAAGAFYKRYKSEGWGRGAPCGHCQRQWGRPSGPAAPPAPWAPTPGPCGPATGASRGRRAGGEGRVGGRDETCPVSTGGRDETCPVSTGERGEGPGKGRQAGGRARERERERERGRGRALKLSSGGARVGGGRARVDDRQRRVLPRLAPARARARGGVGAGARARGATSGLGRWGAAG